MGSKRNIKTSSHSTKQRQAALASFQLKGWFYGKPESIDMVNIKEEIGDVLYYLAILMDEIGTDFATEQERVIAKLRVRYPEKFTTKHATERDLIKERDALE